MNGIRTASFKIINSFLLFFRLKRIRVPGRNGYTLNNLTYSPEEQHTHYYGATE
jgi:hypothetical protein